MPRGDETKVRALAEQMADDSCCALLKMCYCLGGGSETDFITDLEGPIECIIEGQNIPEVLRDKRSSMLRHWYGNAGALHLEEDFEELWERVRALT